MYCKNCGKELSSDAKFCSECGTKVVVEKQEPKIREPLFFTKEMETAAPAKPKKVVHLDEFNWDLEGYPTTPKKTEDVDFNWTSVLEEKARNAAPKISKAATEEKSEEPQVTVEELVEALPEENEVEAGIEQIEEAVEASETENDKSLEEEIFENIADAAIEEPTKLIDKAQMKVEGVDKFYTFNKKQAEFQAMLDEEVARIQNGEADEQEDVLDLEKPPLPDFLIEDKAEPVEYPETAGAADEPEVKPAAEAAEPELVAVVWASAPAGIVIEPAQPETEAPAVETEATEETVTAAEEAISPSKGEEEIPSEGKTDIKTEEPEHKLTFDDVFRDDEDDDEEKEKGGCLKAIAIILCILVIIELGILGVQYFAPNSKAGKLVDQGYRYIINLISGTEEEPEEPVETEGPSEVEQIISAQMGKNENIVAVTENTALVFEEDKDYGFTELPDTYAFQNSPWYDNEEGHSVTFGDEIIGTLIQYYSALSDRMNNVNQDVFDFVDNTSEFYAEVEAIEGSDDSAFSIENLEIGEIRTGGSGFYIMTRLTTVDKEQTEGETEVQVVYLEPNTNKKEMKIIEIQKN